MVTGDNKGTAQSVARQVGLVGGRGGEEAPPPGALDRSLQALTGAGCVGRAGCVCVLWWRRLVAGTGYGCYCCCCGCGCCGVWCLPWAGIIQEQRGGARYQGDKRRRTLPAGELETNSHNSSNPLEYLARLLRPP